MIFAINALIKLLFRYIMNVARINKLLSFTSAGTLLYLQHIIILRVEFAKRKEYMLMGRCIAAIGSVTQTMKAQNALSQESIASKILKLDSTMAKKGCSYGLEFPCYYRNNVRMIIEAAGLRYEEFII